jgi:signal transduction histidine kinase
MSLLEVLQLVGYSTAAALHFWIAALLFKRRRVLRRLERVLLVLASTLGVWHTTNFLVALHTMLGLSDARWTALLRLADTLAVASVTLTYSLLLHAHLHLWAEARRRALTRVERARAYLSYLPLLFLAYAIQRLWTGAYEPMFTRLSNLLLPFALWAGYALCFVAVTDLLIARSSKSQTERKLLGTLAASFLTIATLILAVYAFGVGDGTPLGAYLKTFANLGSLLPTALLAYHIYRYRYLELILKESLIVASFASVVLVVYLYGIRTLALWLTARYGLRPGAVESLMILMLALVAAPFRRWLDRRFRRLFEQETGLLRDVAARIGNSAGRYGQLRELLRFVEERAAEGLGLRRVRLLVATAASDEPVGKDEPERPSFDPDDKSSWESRVLDISREAGWAQVEDAPLLRERGWEAAFPLRREENVVGLLLVDATPDALTQEARSVLELLAAQVAIAIEDSRLVEENVRLERRIAHSERLAALGQMAATVAHEVKNPLSAIKSIAQVMREDDYLKGEYARDLELIVGETDRLSRSVTQMLSFARSETNGDAPRRADELIQSVVQLFRKEAAGRNVSIRAEIETARRELEGACASSLRDALSNLLLNALQATPDGGRVCVTACVRGESLFVSVVDSGPGVARENRSRIWEPFFTTRQRGTGLGLAIVRKRIRETGGDARLAESKGGEGARFELTIPIRARQS